MLKDQLHILLLVCRALHFACSLWSCVQNTFRWFHKYCCCCSTWHPILMLWVLYCLKTWDDEKWSLTPPPKKKNERKKKQKWRSCATLWTRWNFPFELICLIGCHCLPSAYFCCVLICFDILNNKNWDWNIHWCIVLFPDSVYQVFTWFRLIMNLLIHVW